MSNQSPRGPSTGAAPETTAQKRPPTPGFGRKTPGAGREPWTSRPATSTSEEAEAKRRTRSLRGKSGRKPGGQPGKGKTLRRADHLDRVKDHVPSSCMRFAALDEGGNAGRPPGLRSAQCARAADRRFLPAHGLHDHHHRGARLPRPGGGHGAVCRSAGPSDLGRRTGSAAIRCLRHRPGSPTSRWRGWSTACATPITCGNCRRWWRSKGNPRLCVRWLSPHGDPARLRGIAAGARLQFAGRRPARSAQCRAGTSSKP